MADQWTIPERTIPAGDVKYFLRKAGYRFGMMDGNISDEYEPRNITHPGIIQKDRPHEIHYADVLAKHINPNRIKSALRLRELFETNNMDFIEVPDRATVAKKLAELPEDHSELVERLE
tara:strand:+ start:2214 stop:2570 length:357 start_codon:yes stop_codon:yes gene_type:complete